MRFLRVLWRSTVGLKALVAVSGVGLALWVLAHLLGNMTLFAGAATADGYAAGLRRWPALLWSARAGLAAAAAVHVAAIAALARRARAAQPGRPPRPGRAGAAATLASRTMRAGGVLLLVFVALHLLHLTSGTLHPGFVPGRVHDNVVTGLAPPLVAAGYLAACVLLGLHLYHGLWSAARSLGARQRSAGSRPLVAALAILTAVGFAAVPVAVLAGVLR